MQRLFQKQMTACAFERRPFAESLARRRQIEEEAERTGKTSRRHPERVLAERLFIKPFLKAALQATGLYAKGVQNALRPVVHHLSLEFPNLPAAFDGYRILHLSDLHIDCLDLLPAAVAAVLGGIQADVCLMTGDYRFQTQGSCGKTRSGMRKVVSSISAEDGIFAILGNHDPAEMAEALDDMEVSMLINDAVELRRGEDSLWLLGVDDPYDYRCDELPVALQHVPSAAFKILLAHAPDLYGDASASGIDLYLSGHTHAGQVRLPWIGSVIQNSSAPRAYTHGYWRHGEMQGYTSSGVGCSMLPIRFNCPPELVVIELHRSR
ncbi:MAG: metallophosphoesterase [Acidobacteriota bacterium]|nr:metallophosphoesterase [Acidobacteriota bacterium]